MSYCDIFRNYYKVPLFTGSHFILLVEQIIRMRVIVPIKRVIDYAVKVRINKTARNGAGHVELNNVKMSMNPFCEIAVEEAVRLKEKKIADEVVAVTVGPTSYKDVLRTALAMGADRAIHVITPEDLRTDYDLQPVSVAGFLCEVTQKEKADLVLMGKQAIDGDFGQTAGMLAGMLSWPQVTFAAKIDVNSDKSCTVERETDSGTEILRIPQLPAVISCDLRLNEPRYATLPNIMKSKKKKIEEIDIDSNGTMIRLDPYLEVQEIYEPEPRKPGIFVDDVDDLADFRSDVSSGC